MLMHKKNQIAIYELFFKKGMMVVKKDVHMPKHPKLSDKNMSSLHVMKALQFLKFQGYVKEQLDWRYFYWYLTNKGISISEMTSIYLWRAYLPPYTVAVLKVAGLILKVQRVNDLQDSQEGRQTETTTGVLCSLVLTRKAEAQADSVTEFQFRGGFDHGSGQPPQ
ncbi:hypothetical protein STEG23_014934 [Scotinomys teguina]